MLAQVGQFYFGDVGQYYFGANNSAFADDVAKTNMAAILEQNGIANVRSL